MKEKKVRMPSSGAIINNILRQGGNIRNIKILAMENGENGYQKSIEGKQYGRKKKKS